MGPFYTLPPHIPSFYFHHYTLPYVRPCSMVRFLPSPSLCDVLSPFPNLIASAFSFPLPLQHAGANGAGQGLCVPHPWRGGALRLGGVSQ